MENFIIWTIVLIVIAALSLGAFFLLRNFISGGGTGSALFKQRNERRVEVVEHTGIDGKRKLVLIRRDDVEHLLMIGGPVDLVVETGIAAAPRPVAEGVPRQRRNAILPKTEPEPPGFANREL